MTYPMTSLPVSEDMRIRVAAEVGKSLAVPSAFPSHKEYTRLCSLLLYTDYATKVRQIHFFREMCAELVCVYVCVSCNV